MRIMFERETLAGIYSKYINLDRFDRMFEFSRINKLHVCIFDTYALLRLFGKTHWHSNEKGIYSNNGICISFAKISDPSSALQSSWHVSYVNRYIFVDKMCRCFPWQFGSNWTYLILPIHHVQFFFYFFSFHPTLIHLYNLCWNIHVPSWMILIKWNDCVYSCSNPIKLKAYLVTIEIPYSHSSSISLFWCYFKYLRLDTF